MHKLSMILCLMSASLSAQWIHYPAPGIPRLPGGKPNLNAPAPRTVDGKPDLSGLWTTPLVQLDVPELGTIERAREFVNIAATLPGGLPLQPWARDLYNARRERRTERDSPLARCLPGSGRL